jgi:hypothetical protein
MRCAVSREGIEDNLLPPALATALDQVAKDPLGAADAAGSAYDVGDTRHVLDAGESGSHGG